MSTVKINDSYLLDLMIGFTSKVCAEISKGEIGISGGPWELNLRDITRWAEGIEVDLSLSRCFFYNNFINFNKT